MTEHSENFDLNNNPLWDDLVAEAAAARARGESFGLDEINDFISRAAEVQSTSDHDTEDEISSELMGKANG